MDEGTNEQPAADQAGSSIHYHQYAAPQERPTQAYGIIALIVGILSLFGGMLPLANLIFGLPLALVAVVVGGIGLYMEGKGKAEGKGMCITGIVLGGLTIMWSIISSIAVGANM